MKFKDIQKLSNVKFRRLTGVSWATIDLKCNIYFIEALVLKERPDQMPYLIKLIGSDRALLTPYVLKNKFKNNSFLDF